jgi:hypothetical protein
LPGNCLCLYNPAGTTYPAPDFRNYRDQNTVFSSVAAAIPSKMNRHTRHARNDPRRDDYACNNEPARDPAFPKLAIADLPKPERDVRGARRGRGPRGVEMILALEE